MLIQINTLVQKMLEQNDKSEVIKDFLGEIVCDLSKAKILQEIVKITIEDKND